MVRKICVFTGGRAEYGLLKPLLDEIVISHSLELKLLVSGMHLSSEFGLTYKKIEDDGFVCDEKVEMILSSDTAVSICKSMGLGMIGFSEALERIKPDIFVILGDRFESMVAATAALVCRIPVAHIQGGELTFGAIDDQFRHAITKMSLLHFVTTDEYQKRVIQLGEDPDRVFNFGAINVDAMKKIQPLSKSELEKQINFSLGPRTILVTFHPVTLENGTAGNYFSQLLKAIDEIGGLKVIFTKTNADTDGRIINNLIDLYVERNPKNTVAFTSLGQMRYISALHYISAVVGNSSSGIIETPTFKVPTVNIGDREKGRVLANNVITCKQSIKAIRSAIEKVLSGEFKDSIKDMINPYDKDETAKNIVKTIREYEIPSTTKKEFYDVSSTLL
jgi:GDP/UDP-N,N'-diacetylbacillosamine 2-epimerase (hydrolysing)